MEAEGVKFVTNAHVGVNVAVDELRRSWKNRSWDRRTRPPSKIS